MAICTLSCDSECWIPSSRRCLRRIESLEMKWFFDMLPYMWQNKECDHQTRIKHYPNNTTWKNVQTKSEAWCERNERCKDSETGLKIPTGRQEKCKKAEARLWSRNRLFRKIPNPEMTDDDRQSKKIVLMIMARLHQCD